VGEAVIDTVICGDALQVMPAMPSDSVDLIAVDPPYYKVKGDWWDRQWDTPAGFLDWIGQLCESWQRILRPNGSLYVFASPEMSDRVSVKVREWFEVLNRIRWVKEEGWHRKAVPENLRGYLSPYETIIFAEHYGSDGYAKGEAGYTARCDQLRGFVFEPLRAYLDGERRRAGVAKEDINEWLGFRRLGGMAGRHYFSQSQWQLPTDEHYHKMRECLNALNHGGEYLRREYEYLRREYEDLRREYEDLRRPFNATPDAPYTDVWTFKTVAPYPGKHPCEKPLDLMEHIVKMSSKPGGVVFDCCCGNGTTLLAAKKHGRHWYGCDVEEKYVQRAQKRLGQVQMELSL